MDRQDIALQAAFANVDRVVADPLRFKLRLGIGEDAYASLRLKKNIQSWWDVGSWEFTGGAVAASPVVASTFFVPTGFLAVLGFGTAVTPIGWIAAAAIGSAGAYYGVTRLFGRYAGSRVDTIPKFINTPIDVLGAALFDLIGSLAVGVANIDGSIDATETNTIADHFVADGDSIRTMCEARSRCLSPTRAWSASRISRASWRRSRTRTRIVMRRGCAPN